MASHENFSAEEDEILITLVSQYPLLYDLSEEDYRNTRKKDKTWSEIGLKLNKSGKFLLISFTLFFNNSCFARILDRFGS